MPTKYEPLLSLAYGPTVLARCASSWECREITLRVVALLGSSAAIGKQMSVTGVSGLLGVSYTSAIAGVVQARSLGWIEARNQRHQMLRLTLAGLRIAGLLEREEREARQLVGRAELKKWPRRYVRKTQPGA